MLYAILIVLAVLFAAALAFVVYGRANAWEALTGSPDLGPVKLGEIKRSQTENDALLCTPGLCGDVRTDGELPAYDVAPDELIAEIDRAMREAEPHIERVDDAGDPSRARFVTWTPTMRFPDTTNFIAAPLPDGKTGLVAYARAKLGKKDLGNNLKRLERVTGGL